MAVLGWVLGLVSSIALPLAYLLWLEKTIEKSSKPYKNLSKKSWFLLFSLYY